MQNRPLRPFEQGAHLHVLDWAHQTARYRLQAAGAVQVKAAAKAVVRAPSDAQGPLVLPSLQAAVHTELVKLYALGHATVGSELDHQAQHQALPIGLSAAPAPPNLRPATDPAQRCGTCHMFDDGGLCWGYGNYGVEPDETCDSWAPEPVLRTLAVADAASDPSSLLARATLVAQAAAHAVWQAVHRGRLQGITGKRALREAGEQAGSQALSVAASHHAGGTINAGRRAAAEGRRASIAGARYTSVLDKATCGPCAAADTGELLPLDDPALVQPPNPACLGGDRCRCILVYQLVSETARQALPIAAGR
jgi:hypothetical protein